MLCVVLENGVCLIFIDRFWNAGNVLGQDLGRLAVTRRRAVAIK